jgi:peptide deformylase
MIVKHENRVKKELLADAVDGFHARVVQHECDHLWGKLYPMRMRDFSQFGFTEILFPGIAAAEDD